MTLTKQAALFLSTRFHTNLKFMEPTTFRASKFYTHLSKYELTSPKTNSQDNIGFDVAKCATQLLYGPVLVSHPAYRLFVIIDSLCRKSISALILPTNRISNEVSEYTLVVASQLEWYHQISGFLAMPRFIPRGRNLSADPGIAALGPNSNQLPQDRNVTFFFDYNKGRNKEKQCSLTKPLIMF